MINCKNYPQAASFGSLSRLAARAHEAAEEYGAEVLIAPPLHMAGRLAARRRCPVLAQHVDPAGEGGTTGRVAPSMLKKAGIAGSIVNHSERRLPPADVGAAVRELRRLGMISIVCAESPAEARRAAELGPTHVAVEPPELIGTGRSVSTHRPGVVSDAAREVGAAGTGAALLCGAGITTADDAAEAVRLGAAGVLVASGVMQAKNRIEAMRRLAASVARRA